MNVPKDTYWLPEMGNTFMTSLDKNGVFYNFFDTSNNAALIDSLNSLPPNVNGLIVVRIYHGADSGFTQQGTDIQASKGIISTNQETHIKRVFARVNDRLYGIAELTLSYG
jgi:argininosuccinate synthase